MVKGIRNHKGERRGMQKIMPNREMSQRFILPTQVGIIDILILLLIISTQFPHPIPSPLQVKHIPCVEYFISQIVKNYTIK